MGERSGPRHVIRHPGVSRKVQIDVFLCFTPAQTQLLGQPKGRHPVDEAEINRFRLTTLVSGYVTKRNPEHFGSSGAVHIQLVCERIEQPLVLREVRHNAQFNL